MAEEKKEKKISTDRIITGAAVVGLFVLSLLYANDRGLFKRVKNVGTSDSLKSVKVDLYVMSQCPYGTQAEDAIKKVYDKMGDAFTYNINYIADNNGDGTFESLHGENEVKGDIVQLCAAKYDKAAYLDMIDCQNKDASKIPDNWESCAKEAKLENINKIKECYEGQEGKGLLTENIKLAQAKNIASSPTYYINDEAYTGGRDEINFTKFICSKINDEHSACKSIPTCATDTDCNDKANKVGTCINPGEKNSKCEYKDAVRVDLTILNDKRCEDCASLAAEIKSSLGEIFRGLTVKEVDYSSTEGKDIFKLAPNLKMPAFLFATNVKDGEGYSSVQSYLSDFGSYKSLSVGSIFDPTKEICNNNVDDDNNKKIDCADDSCKDQVVCRKEVKKDLQVFVMSDCPYGVAAENSMKEVISAFGKDMKFTINYIATDLGNGKFDSLHGEYEALEDIRQLCVKKNNPTKLMDYIWCRNEQGIEKGVWAECATKNNIDVTTIQNCEKNEGPSLLSENIKIAQSMNVSGSPTWIINNKYQESGIDAETIKTAFCKYNPGLAGCSKTLTGDAGSANTAAGCAQ